MAVMMERESLGFGVSIESDCMPLSPTVQALWDSGIEVYCLRDATRGGLAAVLNEIATDASLRFDLDERTIPVGDEVRGACEVLGLDPLRLLHRPGRRGRAGPGDPEDIDRRPADARSALRRALPRIC